MSPRDRAAIVRAFQESGESVPRFAGRHGVSASSLRRWVAATSAPVSFVGVEVAARTVGLSVRVGGAHIDVEPGFDPTLLRAVVEAIGGGS